MIKLNEVASSTIKAVGYDYEHKDLHVHFINGGEYLYENVPAEVYAKLLEADSKGRFLHAEVIGKYNYAKLK